MLSQRRGAGFTAVCMPVGQEDHVVPFQHVACRLPTGNGFAAREPPGRQIGAPASDKRVHGPRKRLATVVGE